MFGLHKKEKAAALPSDAHIETMPEIFYGGQDPLLYRVPQKIESPSVSQTQQTSPSPAPHVLPISSHKWLWITLSAIFIIVLSGIVWYYVRQVQSVKQTVPPGQISLPTQKISPPTPISPPPPSPPPSIEPSTTTTPPFAKGGVIDFPRLALVDSTDLDLDDLTDVEEELFETDTGVSDSDVDGYGDGQEVFNLYNPKGTAPIKIIDSGLVREYRNPSIGYRLYYPKDWQLDAVNEDNTQVLITSDTGDFIEIRAMPRQPNEEFERWFAANALGQKITDIEILVNRFGTDVKIRKDKLVAFIQSETHILVVVYHPQGNGPITLRHVMSMIIQSMHL